jgi:hypothetical protein
MTRRTFRRRLMVGGAVVAGAAVALLWACSGKEGGTGRPDAQGQGPSRPDGGLTKTGPDAAVVPPLRPGAKLARFETDAAFQQYLKRLEQQQVESDRTRGGPMGGIPMPMAAAESAAPAPTKAAPSEPSPGPGSAAGGESITNTQEVGVDEGDIVKVFGDYLVVLRRGRIFTVRLGAGGQLLPISVIDAFPPGTGGGGYYDEMLIDRNTVVIVGFNYNVGATELGLFDISAAGQLSHRATYYLRSNDYYSSRNYASRLIGDTLIVYMPYDIIQANYEGDHVRLTYTLPGLRRYGETGSVQVANDSWNSIMTTTNIFQPIQPTSSPVLHTVVACDLAAPQMTCRAQGVLGPSGRNFYVSGSAVYIWVQGEGGFAAQPGQPAPGSVVYRLPLQGGDMGAAWVSGVPTDQFSFRESEDSYLNVLVRSEGAGDGMWGPEVAAGDLALMRVPVGQFLEGVTAVAPNRYTALPKPQGAGYELQNRFVGDYVLYGTGTSWGYAAPGQALGGAVYLHPFRGGQTTSLALPHGVDRIEALGSGAAVIGTDGQNLHFSAVSLGPAPAVAGHYLQESASQGETRSHGFFYSPISATEGYLGLPIAGAGRPGYEQLSEGSAEVLFLRVRDFQFSRLGGLVSSPTPAIEDSCIASCDDWYGNARPIFYHGRIFALLGYELVEGQLAGDALSELGRTNYFLRTSGTYGRELE